MMRDMKEIKCYAMHGIAAVAILMIMVAVSSCRKNLPTLYPWGWEALGRPTDSMMVTMENAFIGDASLDSCEALVKRFHKYADGTDAPAIEKARAICWDARLAFVSEDVDEAKALFHKALAATDSVRYPYDARYIHFCLQILDGSIADSSQWDWDWYALMVDDLDFCLAHNARILGAVRAQLLCCFMTANGNPNRALHYAMLADSLYAGGRDDERLNNRMNVAVNRIAVGDTAGAMKDYEWISRQIERGVAHSPMLEPMIDFNRWVEANDTASLLRLRTRAEGNPMLTGYNALASAYLAEMEMERGIPDSLAVRLNDMETGLGELTNGEHIAVVTKMLGRTYKALGNMEKAYEYLNTYPQQAEKNLELLSKDTYSVAESERHISEIERMRDEQQRRERMKFIIITAILTVASMTLGWVIFRLIKRLHREKADRKKAMEQVQRSELTVSLSIREKERLIESLRQKLNALLDNELINTSAVREIESEISSDLGAYKANEEFGRVFTNLSPDFRNRLQEACPHIGRNMMRMAEYIAIGMDNSHIARVMNIKPESVKQNRWRLRTQLNLDTDDNLDKILRDML